jgi:hypothetical protein
MHTAENNIIVITIFLSATSVQYFRRAEVGVETEPKHEATSS